MGMKKIFLLLCIFALVFALTLEVKVLNGPIKGVFVFAHQDKIKLTPAQFIFLNKQTSGVYNINLNFGKLGIKKVVKKVPKSEARKISTDVKFTDMEFIGVYKND